MKIFQNLFVCAVALAVSSCGLVKESAFTNDGTKLWSIGQEMSFLAKYKVDAKVLQNEESMLIYSPTYHGRIFTSSFGDKKTPSLGWYNREAVALKNKNLRTTLIGGEDFFAVGPEGSESSVYFEQGALFTEENKKYPEIVSTSAWKLIDASKTRARFECDGIITNAKGAKFNVKAEREITLLSRGDIEKILGKDIPKNLKLVGFQSMNKLTNTGSQDWSDKYGMLNMSVNSCFNANKTVNTFIPFQKGDASKLGDVVKDNVFDAATTSSGERVVVMDDYIRFKCDGKHMSGIGVSSRRSEGIVLSYDDKNAVLTVVLYIKPSGNRAYFPSTWRNTQTTMDGDAISVFNNGPASKNIYFADLFYEVSTHSPALNLAKEKSQFHLQRTFHFHGSEFDLDLLAYKLTGISLKQMRIK